MARDGCRNGVDHTLLANGLGENRGLFIQRLTLREEVAWLHAKATPETRERSEWRRLHVALHAQKLCLGESGERRQRLQIDAPRKPQRL